jgi:hypothetical protein
MKNSVFWDVAPCRSCVNRRFGGTAECLQPPAHAGSSLEDFSTLKMEAIRSSETSVHTKSTRRHIPEDGILHSHRRENLKSYNYLDISFQDFRGLMTKSVEIFNNVCPFNFIVICITETWLNESFPISFPPQKYILHIVMLRTVTHYHEVEISLLFLKQLLSLNVDLT